MDAEEWQGLIVRACNGRVLGVVQGVFTDGPRVGWLRVHGELASRRRLAWVWTGTLVFAIPHHAVVRRTRRSLVLNVTVAAARARWLAHIQQREVA